MAVTSSQTVRVSPRSGFAPVTRGAHAANRSGFSEVGSTVLGGAVSVVKLLQILCQAQVLLKVGQRLTSPGFQFGVLAAF
jgi:hypothetical protein